MSAFPRVQESPPFSRPPQTSITTTPRMTTRVAPRAHLLAFAVLLSLMAASGRVLPARAQGPTPSEDAVNAIAKQLYCPVCENVPLDVCPTEACRQWRELIRTQLAEGRSEEEIKQYFVANYGARVLAEPPRSGWNWVVYLLPPAMILLGAWIVLRAFKGSTRPGHAPRTSAPQGPEDKYIAELEQELKKRV